MYTMNDDKECIIEAKGYCPQCRCTHSLPQGLARQACIDLMNHLKKHKNLHLFKTDSSQTPFLSTDYLFGKARGKMFGALVGKDVHGQTVTRYAFSGQYNGHWVIPGWVEPICNPDAFIRLTEPKELEIKKLGQRIDQLPQDDPERRYIQKQRKRQSQLLMQQIFSLYRLSNFRNTSSQLTEVYQKEGMPPSGTGDCCAPKLLHHAAKNNIRPIGIAEFYWGKENLSGSRQHGRFYPPCQEKCVPILGFLLCGIDSNNVRT